MAWQGQKMVLPGLADFKFNAPKEILMGMFGGGSDSKFFQKVSKTFMKGGEEKGVNYVYGLDWINRKNEKHKDNIIKKAMLIMGNLFIQTRKTTDGSCFFQRPSETRANLVISRRCV